MLFSLSHYACIIYAPWLTKCFLASSLKLKFKRLLYWEFFTTKWVLYWRGFIYGIMYNTFVYSTAVCTDCSVYTHHATYVTRFGEKNPASMHTISNLRFYQEWIAGSLHYHIPLRAWLSCWCSDGWVSHKGLANFFHFQFRVLWAQGTFTRTPNWTSGFQSSSYSM